MTEENLKRLMSEMTIQEKIGQLVQLAGDCFGSNAMAVGPQKKMGITQETVDVCGSVLNVTGVEEVYRIQSEYLQRSRLKIPLLFMADVIYGYQTVFPIPLGLGATWNPKRIGENYRMIAEEASADGTMVTFSPPADLIRDARWGRCLEMTGEDPYLISRFSAAMTEGFQNNWEKGKSVAACVKHFAGYGAVEAGREYNTVDMSERRLREEYLPGYKAAIDAGCEMVMTSFNTIDEIPSTANEWLLKEVLRNEWNFDGIIITDYAAIDELKAHGIAEDDAGAACLAMNATVDIDMKTSCYANQLEKLMKEGKISESQIDKACFRVLRLKNKLGLFEDPYRGCSPEYREQVTCTPEKLQAARETCNRSMILLKNDGILPLNKNLRLALIGPYADSQDIIGIWAVHADKKHSVTLRKALEERLGCEGFEYAKGCEVLEDTGSLGEFGYYSNGTEDGGSAKQQLDEERKALEAAQEADVVIMALGEHMLQSGEAGSRTDITLPEPQKKLLKKIRKMGKKIVLILFNGRPLVLTDILEDCDAILEAWFPGTAGGRSVWDVLFGDYNPSGRLTVSFPYHVGQEPLYYSQFNTGRPYKKGSKTRFVSRYLDAPNEALFPFGYGLSYHQAEYKNLSLDRNSFLPGEEIQVTVEVINTGKVSGTETVQMYIRDLTGSVVRPIKELKGFQQVELMPGESRKISFTVTEKMLRFHRKDMSFGSEPGMFHVMVGPNSKDLLTAEFTLTERR